LETRLQQVIGTDDIGVDKLTRAIDGAVDVTLGGEVHDGIRLVLREHCTECSGIAEIDLLKGVVRMLGEIGQRLGITGIGQLIEIDDFTVFFFNQQSDKIGADESGSACD
jgi:hypothetical protein